MEELWSFKPKSTDSINNILNSLIVDVMESVENCTIDYNEMKKLFDYLLTYSKEEEKQMKLQILELINALIQIIKDKKKQYQNLDKINQVMKRDKINLKRIIRQNYGNSVNNDKLKVYNDNNDKDTKNQLEFISSYDDLYDSEDEDSEEEIPETNPKPIVKPDPPPDLLDPKPKINKNEKLAKKKSEKFFNEEFNEDIFFINSPKFSIPIVEEDFFEDENEYSLDSQTQFDYGHEKQLREMKKYSTGNSNESKTSYNKNKKGKKKRKNSSSTTEEGFWSMGPTILIDDEESSSNNNNVSKKNGQDLGIRNGGNSNKESHEGRSKYKKGGNKKNWKRRKKRLSKRFGRKTTKQLIREKSNRIYDSDDIEEIVGC